MKHLQTIFNVFFFTTFLLTVWFANMTSHTLDFLYNRQIILEKHIYNLEVTVSELIEGMNDLQYNQEQVSYISVNAQLKSNIVYDKLNTLIGASK